MKTIFKIFFSLGFVFIATSTDARSGAGRSSHGGHHSSSLFSPGTGSSTFSTHVNGHFTKGGKYVESHERSTPDSKFENNWSTKGNVNPTTGKKGTRATPAKGGEVLMQR